MSADPTMTAAADSPENATVTVGLPSSSPEARRLAGTILEVLAGMISITDASLTLGITTARYQLLETRAVIGLIAACEPRAPGPVPGMAAAGEVARLQAERDRLQAEVGRYQALVRVAQSAFGTRAEPAVAPGKTATKATTPARRTSTLPGSALRGDQVRKKRTPMVRAMRLAKRVREAPADTTTAKTSTPGSSAGTSAPTTGG